MSVVDKTRLNPLAMLGKREIEGLTDQNTGNRLNFRPMHSVAMFDQERADNRLRKGVNSIADVSRAVMKGYVIYPTR